MNETGEPVPAQGIQNSLKLPENYVILDAVMRQYLELRLRALMTEVNWINAHLGRKPKACGKCGAKVG